MRTIAAATVLLAGTTMLGFAQADKSKLMSENKQSPAMETSVTINSDPIWIVYHAPSVRGRKIFGGEGALQPDGTVWRLGADWATVLHTEAALDFNGLAVPAGDYSLFLALDAGKWQLIINKQTGQWGIKRGGVANFDPANDVGRVPLTMSKPASTVEQLSIKLSSAGGNKGKLDIAWENLAGSTTFTVK